MAAIVSLGAGTLAVAGAAGAAPDQASNPSVPQGGTTSVSATLPINKDCPASATVTLASGPGPGGANLFPDGVGPQVTRDSSGMFTATFTVPLSTPLGAYPISVACLGKAGSIETLDVTAAVSVKASLTVAPASAAPGATVTFSGQVPETSGVVVCPASEATQLSGPPALFPPAGVGPQLNRGNNGTFSQPYKIPTNAPAGTFSVGVRCGTSSGSLVVSTNLQVTGTATTTSSTSTTSTTVAKTTTTTKLAPTTLVFPGGTTTTTPLAFPTVPTVSTPASSSKRGLSITALGLIGLALIVICFLVAIVVYSGRP